MFRDALKTTPVDVVIIPTSWRVKDIVLEMKSEGIEIPKILIEKHGTLVNYN